IQEFLQVFSKRNPTLPLETNLCSLKAATEVLKNSNVIKISRANKITLSVRAKDVEDILKDKKPLLKKALIKKPQKSQKYVSKAEMRRIISKIGSEPKQVSFTPYNDSQIMEIIKDRLLAAASAEKENSIMMSEKPISSSLMQDKAIELCAKKVAACNGDLRLALNICMKAIELVEEELEEKETEEKKLEEKEKDRKKSIKKTVLSDSENSLEQQQKISMPEITITHINQIINTDIIISPITNRLRSLNHAQSMALFAIVCLIKKKEKKIDLTK
ncbi:19959_t:CDS:2, partial [Entrophospora sp. SA101]